MTRRLSSWTGAALAAAAVLFFPPGEAALAQTGTDAPTEPSCGPIVVAEFAWPAARLAARLTEALLRDGAGCAVSVSSAAPEPVRRLLLQPADASRAGDPAGRLIAPAITLPDDWRRALPAEAAARLRYGPPLFGGGETSGFFTLAWLQRAAGAMTSFEAAVANPKLFARRPGERPRLHLCPQAWPCHQDSLETAERLRLAERFELVTPASGEALTEALTRAAEDAAPWLGYYWTPSAAAAQIPLAPLRVETIRICDDDGGSCRAPFAAASSHIAYAAELETTAPLATEIVRRLVTPTQPMLDTLAWRTANNASWSEAVDFLASTAPSIWRDALPKTAQLRFEAALTERLTSEPRN